ncbi:MAG TPA: TIM barrel protein [Sedimentisphaerales bacterium]|jgi:hydroxypyruvate isomerase|nr:TIM barrel protein [Sedimentisphaerales bacterium]HNU28195.1 TIM barrel protein [Sedimentisphaerales bacterium]
MKNNPSTQVSRRSFISTAAATAAFAASLSPSGAKAAESPKKFKLKYAPSLGAFPKHAGRDPIDQIKFMADEGFSAMFDNGLMGRPPEQQEQIAKEMDRLGMTLGPFVMYAEFGKPTFVTQDKEFQDQIVNTTKQAVEVAKRTRCKWTLIAPGCISQRMEIDYQTANLIDNVRRCVEIAEPAGVVIVLEPLNWWRDHPGLFLQKIPQAYLVCRAVNSPSCKIVDDLYHQQITEGNLIPNIDKAWSEIGAFHLGDNPGRNEPGTGEINYKNIFRHIYHKGYQGVLCMEHGKSKGDSKESERAVIDAYRACDDFEV